jgi:peptidoglycan/xylan/chitin deacetylase (PgdA/CDA1 family)
MMIYFRYITIIGILPLVTCCYNYGTKRQNFIQDTVVEERNYQYDHGAIVRGDTSTKEIALVFTGDEFGDGGLFISNTLKRHDINASFFLTGNFYRNSKFTSLIRDLKRNGNYLGSHSDRHLLYCDWIKRDSLLVSRQDFIRDLENSYAEMARYGISREDDDFFLPPFEWYNDSIACWTSESGLQLVNFSSGTKSNADYSYPEMGIQYADSRSIYNSILLYEKENVSGLRGFILLIHIGTDPRRSDKFYHLLPNLIDDLTERGYRFVRIDDLLKEL